MKCLRSGYCCIQCEVIILIDPDLGFEESNMEAKHTAQSQGTALPFSRSTGEICRHLIGISPGNFSCAIHEHTNYPRTPCYAYGQIEVGNTNCRMGSFVLKPENEKFRTMLSEAK